MRIHPTPLHIYIFKNKLKKQELNVEAMQAKESAAKEKDAVSKAR